jgi:hypothetical protein
LSQRIHIILDNYSTHKHPVVKRWLARHPRFELHFTPTGSSWMNLVERFFRDLSQQAILPGSFGSVRQLVGAIMEYLAQHNLNPKRYVWKAKGEEILAKIERAWKVALGEDKDVTIIQQTSRGGVPSRYFAAGSTRRFWCKLLKGLVSCDNCRDDGTDLGTRSVQRTAF